MDKPITFNEWLGTQGNMVLLHANCCRIAYEAGQQSMQAKVEELQTQLSLQRQRVKAFEEELTSSRNYGDELQKRVDAALKLIESWNEIAFDKTTHWTEGYEEGCYHCAAQLEQALKGEGQ
ncbi:hypothetical protein [Acinetobacter baumannii]|uniref:hypothetical protein n=1 Tax=Acinetobacter baumannii TaxID=470 RepID=UPI003219CB03